jgi:hypothetical protein
MAVCGRVARIDPNALTRLSRVQAKRVEVNPLHPLT